METVGVVELRRSILACQACFGDSREGCLHHEDLVGGYAPGKIVFVGINPQAPANSTFYQTVQDAEDAEKMLLGDHLRHILAGRIAPPELRPELYLEHPGREWIKRSAKCLGLSLPELADHTQGIELFKHASAGVSDLLQLGTAWNEMQKKCPEWLKSQLAVLQPSLVVFSGATGLKFARAYVESKDLPLQISDAHGRLFQANFGTWQGSVLFTLAVSRQSQWMWNNREVESNQVRAIIREHIGQAPSAHENSQRRDVTASKAMFVVESKHEQIQWNGSLSCGTPCDGYSTYLHLIPLTTDVIERIATADWQERGGRKFGPLLSDEGSFAQSAKDPNAWFFTKTPSGHFPNVSPRVTSKLVCGCPKPLSPAELEALQA